VLTGSGKAFSSGGDLSMIARDTGARAGGDAPACRAATGLLRPLSCDPQSAHPDDCGDQRSCDWRRAGIALACDMRVAVADAKLGMTFTKLGIHPGMGATYFLPRLIGTARACELFSPAGCSTPPKRNGSVSSIALRRATASRRRSLRWLGR